MSGYDDESSDRRPRKARHVSIDLPTKEDLHARYVQQIAKMRCKDDDLKEEVAALDFPNKYLRMTVSVEDAPMVEPALTKLGIDFKRTEGVTLKYRGVRFGYAVDALQMLKVLQSDTTKRAWVKCKDHEEKEKGKAPEGPLVRRTVPLMEGERVELLEIGFAAVDALGIPRHKPASEHFPATDFGWISRDIKTVEKEIAIANGEDPDAAGAEAASRRPRRGTARR